MINMYFLDFSRMLIGELDIENWLTISHESGKYSNESSAMSQYSQFLSSRYSTYSTNSNSKLGLIKYQVRNSFVKWGTFKNKTQMTHTLPPFGKIWFIFVLLVHKAHIWLIISAVNRAGNGWDGDNDGGRGHVSRVSLWAGMRRGDTLHHLNWNFLHLNRY